MSSGELDMITSVITSINALQDADEFILPTGANKTRGRFELAFFTIGSCCMTGRLSLHFSFDFYTVDM